MLYPAELWAHTKKPLNFQALWSFGFLPPFSKKGNFVQTLTKKKNAPCAQLVHYFSPLAFSTDTSRASNPMPPKASSRVFSIFSTARICSLQTT